MTTSQLCRWTMTAALLGAVGCGRSAPTEPATVAPAISAPLTNDLQPNQAQAADDQNKLPPTKPAERHVTLPNDMGGKAVAKVLAAPSPLPPDTSANTKPVPYSSPLDHGEMPLPPVALKPFASTPPSGSSAKPSAPRERHPPASSATALPDGHTTERPLVKAPAPSNPRAADVPMQAWKQHDRPPIDDPTADLSAGRVIDTPLPMLRGPLPFLRVSIPDPFELVEHLKGKLGKETEVGVGPPK